MALPRLFRTALPLALALAFSTLLASAALAAEVRLTDAGFEPASIEVAAGETIVWINDTDGSRTIVGPDGSWDSGPLSPGETFSIALRQAGTVTYGTEDGATQGQITVGATAAPVVDAAAPALPRTGIPVGSLLAAVIGLIGAGVVLVARTGKR